MNQLYDRSERRSLFGGYRKMKTEFMATETKITVKELILKRAEISKKIADFEEKISNEEWSPLLRKFYKESIPCENGVVYEVTSKHGKSKKYNRFIVYT